MFTTVDVTESMPSITYIQRLSALSTPQDVVRTALVELVNRRRVERFRGSVTVTRDPSSRDYSVTCAVDELTSTADTYAAAVDRFITAVRSWSDGWSMRTGYSGAPADHADFAEAVMVLSDEALRSALSRPETPDGAIAGLAIGRHGPLYPSLGDSG